MRPAIPTLFLAATLVSLWGNSAPRSLAQTELTAPALSILPLSTSLASQHHAPGELLPIREVPTGPVTLGTVRAAIAGIAGKLNIQTHDGASHYCSGMFVNSSVVLTAAHCLQENGPNQYYTVSGFETDSQTHTLVSSCVFLPPQWSTVTHEYLRIQYDYAFIKVTPAATNMPNNLMFGSGNPVGNSVIAIGYPFTAVGGLQGVDGVIHRDVLHPRLASLSTTSLGFTRGTSGGSWVDQGSGPSGPYRIFSTNSSYAVGVSDKTSMRLYGPDLTAGDVSTLLTNATNCP